MALSMEVHDAFTLGDGRTIFVGDVEDHPSRIGRMAVDLVVDGEVRQRLALDGEEMPERRGRRYPTRRAVGTSERIALTPDELRSRRYRLEQPPD